MINVTVTSVSITKGEMVVEVSTTNTNNPGITQTFSIVEGASQTLEGVMKTIEGAAKMMWAGYGNPSWDVIEE
jgi:hypothetical protein